MDKLERTKELKAYIRNGPYAWPGGYRLLMVAGDGEEICYDCVKENYRLILSATRNGWDKSWMFMGSTVHWEGPPLQCANCNKELVSEYGELENDDDCIK